MLQVEIKGLNEMKQAFAKSPALFTRVFDTAIKKATYSLLGTSRMATPVDTGFLRGPSMQTSFSALVGRIENTAPYAIYVHEGTIHQKARPFFQEGIESGQNEVDNIFDQALQEFTNQL